ncbi:DUF1376 domain-containing protein [Nitrospirillum amazonense]|uniref:DUF1376 domain-containing protein n=1 Tax=Nitrospirillum amazonense TaxID=28077 RepID=UPI002DD4257B|nr:DUF1376 domain-containing protein [Nitrospirillum amazonense]MEC4590553.1 DUF1376 domain-containing protein [Nitrospirillum amazonense]
MSTEVSDVAQFPALPLWTDAFIADTTHLTAEETGGYIMLLMCAWRRPDCDLPDDDVLLQRWSRIGARRWPKVRDRVMSFWTLADGRWTQKRLAREHEFVSHRRSVLSANAKAKHRKNKETPSAIGEQNACKTNAPTPTPIFLTGAEAPSSLEKQTFDLGRQLLGRAAGGLVTKLRRHHHDDWNAVLQTLRLASEKAAPAEYVGAILRASPSTRARPQAADLPEFDLVNR